MAHWTRLLHLFIAFILIQARNSFLQVQSVYTNLPSHLWTYSILNRVPTQDQTSFRSLARQSRDIVDSGLESSVLKRLSILRDTRFKKSLSSIFEYLEHAKSQRNTKLFKQALTELAHKQQQDDGVTVKKALDAISKCMARHMDEKRSGYQTIEAGATLLGRINELGPDVTDQDNSTPKDFAVHIGFNLSDLTFTTDHAIELIKIEFGHTSLVLTVQRHQLYHTEIALLKMFVQTPTHNKSFRVTEIPMHTTHVKIGFGVDMGALYSPLSIAPVVIVQTDVEGLPRTKFKVYRSYAPRSPVQLHHRPGSIYVPIGSKMITSLRISNTFTSGEGGQPTSGIRLSEVMLVQRKDMESEGVFSVSEDGSLELSMQYCILDNVTGLVHPDFCHSQL